jgi:hypothetical protein
MTYKSDRPLYATKDGRVVEEGDPDAAIVIANRAGKELSEDIVRKYNLRGEQPEEGSESAEEPVAEPAGSKQARGENKALKGVENK